MSLMLLSRKANNEVEVEACRRRFMVVDKEQFDERASDQAMIRMGCVQHIRSIWPTEVIHIEDSSSLMMKLWRKDQKVIVRKRAPIIPLLDKASAAFNPWQSLSLEERPPGFSDGTDYRLYRRH